MSCNIEEIKKTGKFVWGEPVKWHNIGPYTLLEYHPWETDGNRIKRGVVGKEISFHGWLDNGNTSNSWPTLEAGIIGLIGQKWAGLNNGGVEYYFCRGIQAPPYNEGEAP